MNKKKIAAYTFPLFAFLAIFAVFVGIETFSLAFLKIKGIPRKAFLLNRLPTFNFAEAITYPYLDPLLSHASNEPFTAYGEDSGITIVALGGSSTAPLTGKSNWPELLASQIKSTGKKVRVLNGGVGGYSSNQELLKTIRDVLPIKPRVLITFDGINDFGNHSTDDHPMLHPYQKSLYATLLNPTALFLPNTVLMVNTVTNALFHKPKLEVRMGAPYRDSLATNWAKNQRLINAASKEMGIHHFSYLQPTNGVGKYTPTAKELQELNSIVYKETSPGYVAVANHFYSEARTLCKKFTFCHDYTDLFQGRTGLYDDPRHPTAEGYALIAQNILKDLESKKLLD